MDRINPGQDKLEDKMREQKHFNRWLYLLGLIPLILALILSFYYFYLVLAPIKILEIRKTPSIVQPLDIIAGDTIEIEIDYCKYKEIYADLSILFLGPVVVESLQTQTTLPTGCHANGRIPIVTPTTLPTGQWSITMRFVYQVNGVRREVIDVETEKFNVTENPAIKRLLDRSSTAN